MGDFGTEGGSSLTIVLNMYTIPRLMEFAWCKDLELALRPSDNGCGQNVDMMLIYFRGHFFYFELCNFKSIQTHIFSKLHENIT